MTLLSSPVAPPRCADVLSRLAAEPEGVEALHDAFGDFCHLVRNRLNSLQIGVYLARTTADPRSSAWRDVDEQCRAAVQVIELFQSVCRPMTLHPITIGLDLVLRDFANRWSPKFEARGVALRLVCPPPDEPSRIDPTRIAQALDAFVAWRLEEAEAGSTVVITGRSCHTGSRIAWSEGEAAGNISRGALGLGLLSRVAALHGGRLVPTCGPELHVVVEWPNASEPARRDTSA